jgi:glycine/D-amino acid oxidase-like deaminating enzyme
MKTFDWIVVGAGVVGAGLSYELVKQGFSVLLLEQSIAPQGATRFSYGGIAYWSGTTTVMRQLCSESLARHHTLSQELAGDTQFREMDLLLTIAADQDPQQLVDSYRHCAIPPELISVEEAWKREPLLNPHAIAGALTVRHGNVHPEAITQAYTQAFLNLGGKFLIEPMVQLVRQGNAITGATTPNDTYHANNVVICAGGISRTLLKEAGISVRLYFTHAEIIETPAVDLQLRTLVMPADAKRFVMEAKAGQPEFDDLWNEPGNEPTPAILDAGAVQFLDGSLRIGQYSRVLTDPAAQVDATESETALRSEIGKVLPALKELPGTWQHCLVPFCADRLPLVGAIPAMTGIHIFAGFSNPFAILPAVAKRFATQAHGQTDDLLAQLSPDRFSESLVS